MRRARRRQNRRIIRHRRRLRRKKEAMGNADDKPALKITLEDLAKVQVRTEAAAVAVAAAGARTYGNIAGAGTDAPAAVTEEKGSIFLKGWFYLGLAGLLGSLIGWGICEPFFLDSRIENRWGNILMMPMVIMFTCLGLGVAESIVERSPKKATIRGLLGLALGLVFGFIFDRIANIFFYVGMRFLLEMGV